MNIFSFGVHFTYETSCRLHFKGQRDKQDAVCKHCQETDHHWLINKWSDQCKSCNSRTSLHSATIMESSKLSFIFLVLFSCSMLQAQVQTSTITGILNVDASNSLLQTKRVQNMNINFSFRFNKLPNIDGINSFSRFNRVTGLNDTYIRYQEKYSYTSSSIFLENQFRISKIDSFNPNGATDFGHAVVIGILNLLFN